MVRFLQGELFTGSSLDTAPKATVDREILAGVDKPRLEQYLVGTERGPGGQEDRQLLLDHDSFMQLLLTREGG